MKRRRFLHLGARATTCAWFYVAGFGPDRAWGQGADPESDAGDADPGRFDPSSADPARLDPGADAPLERTPGLNAVEVRLGMSADFSGAGAETSIDALRGALAWLNEVNDGGGVEGRRLTLLALDDRGDPALAVRNVRALLDDDEVFCLFNFVGTETLGHVLPLLYARRDEDLWLLGEISGARPQRRRPFADQVFPVRASHRVEMAALVGALLGGEGPGGGDGLGDGRQAPRRLGLLYPITPHGRSGAEAAKVAIDGSDAELVGEATWRPGGSTDRHLRRGLAHLRSRGADGLVIVGDGAAAARALAQTRDDGWAVPAAIGAAIDAGENGAPTSLGARPATYSSRVVPFPAGDDEPATPAEQQLQTLLSRWRPHPPPALIARAAVDGGAQRSTAATLEGFLHARLLTAGLRLAGPWPTRRGVADALVSLRGYDLGLGAAVDMADPEARGLGRVFLARWDGERWRPEDAPLSPVARDGDAASADAADDDAIDDLSDGDAVDGDAIDGDLSDGDGGGEDAGGGSADGVDAPDEPDAADDDGETR